MKIICQSCLFHSKIIHWYIAILLLTLPLLLVAMDPKPNRTVPKDKCNICVNISKKFLEGLRKTEKANFGGGNTKWEEKSLGKFKYSETRLVEIMEDICESASKECHQLVEENEDYIEYYWENEFPTQTPTDFHKWFCIDHIKVCCDNGSYGADCSTCPATPTICNSKGSCDGDVTRGGTGICLCNSGYTGTLCDDCQQNYYKSNDESSGVTCEACDESCKDTCSTGGPRGCTECKSGYSLVENSGCIDNDECSENGNTCESTEFCVNKPGTYECQKCDVACIQCTAAGPGNCIGCNPGYISSDSTCEDVNECMDASLCIGQHEVCENTPGSYFCGCKDGYLRSNDECIPKPPQDNENIDNLAPENATDGDVPRATLDDLDDDSPLDEDKQSPHDIPDSTREEL